MGGIRGAAMRAATACLVFVATGGTADAGFVVEVVPLHFLGDAGSLFHPGGSLSAPQFDPALGTLTAVEVDFQAVNATTQLTASNVSGLPSRAYSYSITQAFQITFNGNPVGAFASYASPVTPLSTSPFAFYVPAFTLTGSNVDNAPTAFYIGHGAWSMDLYSAQDFLPHPGLGMSLERSSTGAIDGSVTVTYTYAAVPEPSACVAMLIGLAGGALGMRRRIE